MATKDYALIYGTGDPASFTGLSPTLVQFFQMSNGATLTAPGITEIFPSSGVYRFQYEATLAVFFKADGGATLSTSLRYLTGILDPLDVIDQRIGSTASSFGSTSTDPGDLFGLAKRNMEINEGNATFAKSTGVWQLSSRGSSTVLREKTLTNSSSQATKT